MGHQVSKPKNPDRPVLWLVRQGDVLKPYSRFDADIVSGFAHGAHITCTLEQPPDELLIKRWHGLLNLIGKATGQEPEILKAQWIIAAGFFHSIDHFEGMGTGFTRKSITELGNDELMRLWDFSVQEVLTKHIPHMTEPDLIEKVNRYIGVRDGI